MSLDVTSWAFSLEDIPVEFTGDGQNISPPLQWTPGPDRTKVYALIMDDPDGSDGTCVHWVAWNIRDVKLLKSIARQPHVDTNKGRICQGANSFGRVGYDGPCPPVGTHRYFFKVYALDTELTLGPDATKRDLLQAMEGHVLTSGELMVTYSRARGLAGRRSKPKAQTRVAPRG